MMDDDKSEDPPNDLEIEGRAEPAGPDETSSYAVGYGKPPVATRFKPKRSGNPAGRKKKVVIEDARTTVEEFFDETVKVRDGSRTRRLTKMEATINILRMNALKGSAKHAKALFALAKKTGQFSKSGRKSSIVLTEPGSDSEKRLLRIFHARKPDFPTLDEACDVVQVKQGE
jgi:hypothetical protein